MVEQPIIRLNEADLSGANLSGMQLFEANLEGVILTDADLSKATLCQLMRGSASWESAVERGGNWYDLMQPVVTSDLSSANLSSAVLEQATLVGCNLTFSNFAGANLNDLNEADLRAAELREARNLTQAQIDQAYRASGGQDYIRNTQLPKPLQAPEAWNTLLSQQIAEREATSN
jgi:uncharacterized protein YjbI with pentapeptide repeats